MDLSRIAEMGTAGLLFMALAIIYKLLGWRYPILNGGGHQKRAADYLQSMDHKMDQHLAMTREIRVSQTKSNEAHMDQFARRNDGTFRWHNSAEREKEISETHAMVKEIKGYVKRGFNET